MRLFRYWARTDAERGNRHRGTICASGVGYSDTSYEAALQVARQRAEAQLDRMESFLDNPRARGDAALYYPATVRPLREEIIETLTHDERPLAIISRNSYGSLILNTGEVFFADVDIPPSRPANVPFREMSRLWDWIRGVSRKPAGTFEEGLISDIRNVVTAEPRLALRLYRTLAGYRIAILSQTIPAATSRSSRLLTRLGSDRLYVSLCKSQDSYRARLTPKPWRMGMSRPPGRFPWRDAEVEREQRRWESLYDQARGGFCTCILVGEFGSDIRDPLVDRVLQVHDLFCLSGSELPLA